MSFGIILKEGEQIVHSWKGAYERPIARGYLVLTNQRLVWCRETGFFKKTIFVAFDIHLREIKGISLDKQFVRITDECGVKTFWLPEVGSEESSMFKEMIMRQKESS